MACLCPGIVQVYRFTVSIEMLGGTPTVSYKDDIAGTFNRMQGHAAAKSGNTSKVTGTQSMTNLVLQGCSRIENRLVMEQNNANAAVAAQNMEERQKVNVADEINKLKKLHEDGVLNEEEFEKAKTKVLSS